MGGGQSANVLHATQNKRSIADVVGVMFPVYYTESEVTESDHKLANETWDLILDDTSPLYMEGQKDPAFAAEYGSCIMFFYDTFYRRLFDVHPMCKAMFKSGMKAQGKALVKIVTLSLSMFHEDARFDAVLAKLATVHNERGVKAVEYGIMGESLIWALSKVLGAATFTPAVMTAWIRVYCRMLKVMLPLAVTHELDHGEAQKKRIKEMQEEMERNSAKS